MQHSFTLDKLLIKLSNYCIWVLKRVLQNNTLMYGNLAIRLHWATRYHSFACRGGVQGGGEWWEWWKVGAKGNSGLQMCNVNKQGKHWCMLMFSTEKHGGNNKPDIAHHKVPLQIQILQLSESAKLTKRKHSHIHTRKHTRTLQLNTQTHAIKMQRVRCRQQHACRVHDESLSNKVWSVEN